uniref:Transmembrane protein n=1 Tax=Schizaphis graminum TaxID=13262 RepID=A0A2S2PJL7_SCHGA
MVSGSAVSQVASTSHVQQESSECALPNEQEYISILFINKKCCFFYFFIAISLALILHLHIIMFYNIILRLLLYKTIFTQTLSGTIILSLYVEPRTTEWLELLTKSNA